MPDEILVLILNTTRAPPLHVVGVCVCVFTAMHTTLTSATLAHTDTHTYELMPFIAH